MTLRDSIREMVRYVQGQPECNPKLPWCPRCEAFEDAWQDKPPHAFRNGLMNLSRELLRIAQWEYGPHTVPENVVTAAQIIDAEKPATRRWKDATRAVWADAVRGAEGA